LRALAFPVAKLLPNLIWVLSLFARASLQVGGFDSDRSHVYPDRVFALVTSSRPGDLVGYLASIPGASEDEHCRLVNSAGLALMDPTLRCVVLVPSWSTRPFISLVLWVFLILDFLSFLRMFLF
jgi:hypothetical protein